MPRDGSAPKVLLSLFDGTGSICKPFLDAGWTVRRLDVDGSHGADIVVDVLDWNPATEWSGPPPDVIFAGPPCENYSTARTRAKTPRDLRLADSLVTKAIDIIEHFHGLNQALQYYVENPDTSMLWKRWVSHRLYRDVANHPQSVLVEMMNGAPEKKKSYGALTRFMSAGFKASCHDKNVVRLDYCQYRARYRKRTRLMTNNPFRGLMCNGGCPSVKGGRHAEVAQRGPRYVTARRKESQLGKSNHSLDDLHAYPSALVEAVFRHTAAESTFRDARPGVGATRPEPALTTLGPE